MASTSSVLQTRCLTACRAATVAAAAGVLAATWAAVDVLRVFAGLGGFLGGRNRGRLPFLEVSVGESAIDASAPEGGEGRTTVRLRVHVGGVDLGTAENLSHAILAAALASLRSETADNLCAWGSDRIGALEPGPWGCQRDAEAEVIQTWQRADYEVT
jgi:hypothetical protein